MARLTLVFVFTLVAAAAAQTPLSQLGVVDSDALVADAAKLEEVMKCLLADSGASCSSDGKIVRRLAEETVRNDCADCTEAQKTNVAKLQVYLSNNKPEFSSKLQNKYDPTGEYRAKNAEALRARGVKISTP